MSNLIIISSGSSSENEQKTKSDYSTPLVETKKYCEKNPHSKILADTMKRLQNFANTVEQYHDDEEREKEKEREREKEKEKEKDISDEEKEKKTKKNKTPKKKKLQTVVPITPPPPEMNDSIHHSEDHHKENCVKVVDEIQKYFNGKYSKIAIIIALHKHCGKVADAMKALQNGEVSEDPKVLVDINAVNGTKQEKSCYFCN